MLKKKKGSLDRSLKNKDYSDDIYTPVSISLQHALKSFDDKVSALYRSTSIRFTSEKYKDFVTKYNYEINGAISKRAILQNINNLRKNGVQDILRLYLQALSVKLQSTICFNICIKPNQKDRYESKKNDEQQLLFKEQIIFEKSKM